jgi:HNH/ENDO VII superfamily nuclease with conserved GHE residues/Domain of unknown function (DUF4150)
MVYGKAGDDTNYTSTVKSNGLIIKKSDSKFTRTYGDEPGVAKGVKSGTVMDVVEPVTHSPIVKVEGKPIIRHRDTCTLNNGNCPGEYVHVKSTKTHEPPDGNDKQDKSAWKSFKDQLYDKSGTVQTADGMLDKAGEYWNDPSKIKSDAGSAWDAIPSWQDVKDFGSNVGSGIYNAGEQVVTDPLGTGGKVLDWGSGKVADGWQGTKDAWNKDGAAGVLGAGVGAGIDLINPGKKVKMAGEVAEGAGDLGKKAAKEAAEKEAKEKAAKEAAKRKAEEDGAPGARSTKQKPYSDPKKRPKYADGQVDEAWERAKDKNGDVYDPNTGEKLEWDKTKSRAGQWDMGHKPGFDYKKLHQDYMNGKISQEDFLQQYRNPNNYRPESVSGKRSHRYEMD